MPKARVSGLSIDYTVEGRGEPLLLIMGFSGSKVGWFFQRRAFRKRLQVVTSGARGVGHWDKLPWLNSIPRPDLADTRAPLLLDHYW
jgi:pimeloyl-ACP methyl ester carboxylesterase